MPVNNTQPSTIQWDARFKPQFQNQARQIQNSFKTDLQRARKANQQQLMPLYKKYNAKDRNTLIQNIGSRHRKQLTPALGYAQEQNRQYKIRNAKTDQQRQQYMENPYGKAGGYQTLMTNNAGKQIVGAFGRQLSSNVWNGIVGGARDIAALGLMAAESPVYLGYKLGQKIFGGNEPYRGLSSRFEQATGKYFGQNWGDASAGWNTVGNISASLAPAVLSGGASLAARASASAAREGANIGTRILAKNVGTVGGMARGTVAAAKATPRVIGQGLKAGYQTLHNAPTLFRQGMYYAGQGLKAGWRGTKAGFKAAGQGLKAGWNATGRAAKMTYNHPQAVAKIVGGRAWNGLYNYGLRPVGRAFMNITKPVRTRRRYIFRDLNNPSSPSSMFGRFGRVVAHDTKQLGKAVGKSMYYEAPQQAMDGLTQSYQRSIAARTDLTEQQKATLMNRAQRVNNAANWVFTWGRFKPKRLFDPRKVKLANGGYRTVRSFGDKAVPLAANYKGYENMMGMFSNKYSAQGSLQDALKHYQETGKYFEDQDSMTPAQIVQRLNRMGNNSAIRQPYQFRGFDHAIKNVLTTPIATFAPGGRGAVGAVTNFVAPMFVYRGAQAAGIRHGETAAQTKARIAQGHMNNAVNANMQAIMDSDNPNKTEAEIYDSQYNALRQMQRSHMLAKQDLFNQNQGSQLQGLVGSVFGTPSNSNMQAMLAQVQTGTAPTIFRYFMRKGIQNQINSAKKQFDAMSKEQDPAKRQQMMKNMVKSNISLMNQQRVFGALTRQQRADMIGNLTKDWKVADYQALRYLPGMSQQKLNSDEQFFANSMQTYGVQAVLDASLKRQASSNPLDQAQRIYGISKAIGATGAADTPVAQMWLDKTAQNIKGVIWDNPWQYLPRAMGLKLKFSGAQGLGQMANNPYAFWGTLAMVLAGTPLLIGGIGSIAKGMMDKSKQQQEEQSEVPQVPVNFNQSTYL